MSDPTPDPRRAALQAELRRRSLVAELERRKGGEAASPVPQAPAPVAPPAPQGPPPGQFFANMPTGPVSGTQDPARPDASRSTFADVEGFAPATPLPEDPQWLKDWAERASQATDFQAPMQAAKRIAYAPDASMADAGMAGAAGGANSVLQTAFSPLAGITTAPGVHQVMSVLGLPARGAAKLTELLGGGEAAQSLAEAGTNVALLKAMPAAERAIGSGITNARVARALGRETPVLPEAPRAVPEVVSPRARFGEVGEPAPVNVPPEAPNFTGTAGMRGAPEAAAAELAARNAPLAEPPVTPPAPVTPAPEAAPFGGIGQGPKPQLPNLSPGETAKLLRAPRRFGKGPQETVPPETRTSARPMAEEPTPPVPEVPPRETAPPPSPRPLPPEPAPAPAEAPPAEAPRSLAPPVAEPAAEVPRGAPEVVAKEPIKQPVASEPAPVEPAPAPAVNKPSTSVHPLAEQYLNTLRTDGPEAAAEFYRRLTSEQRNVAEKTIPPATEKGRALFGGPRLRKWAEGELAKTEGTPTPAPETPPAKPKFGSRRGMGKGPRGGEAGMAENPAKIVNKSIEAIYDAADEIGSQALAAGGRAALKVPGVKPVVEGVGKLYEKGFKSESQKIGPEFAQKTAELRGARNVARDEASRTAEEFHKAVKDLPVEDTEAIGRYMSSEADTLPASAQHLKPLIDRVSAQIGDVGKALVERDILSQEAWQQFERYLPRLYESKRSRLMGQGNGPRPRVGENFLREDAYGVLHKLDKSYPEIRDIAKQHGGYALTRKGNIGAVKFKTPEARDAFMAEIRDKFSFARRSLGENATREIRAGDVGQAKMLMRGEADVPRVGDIVVGKFDPLPMEIRDLLGEIRDPTKLINQAIASGKIRVADYEFMKGLIDGADAKGEWVRSEPASNYVHVTERWAGPLRGKHVRTDVYEQLKGSFDKKDPLGFMRGALDQWKANKTVWSPRTAMRQFFGNPLFMHLAGVDPLNPTNAAAIAKAVKSIRRDSPLRPELVREGVLGPHDFASIELHSSDTMGSSYNAGKYIVNPVTATEMGSKLQRGLGKFYGTSDAITRASIYWKNIERGLSPSDAAAEARKWTPNYDDPGVVVKKLRESPFGSPFATYKYETYRILGTALKEHPVRLATGAAMIYGLKKALQSNTDLTDDEINAITKIRGSQEFALGRDENGRPLSFNSRYINPVGDIEPEVQRIGDDQTLEYIASLFGMDAAPATDLIATVARGEDRFGRPIYPPMASAGEKAQGVAGAFVKQAAPGLTPGVGAQAEQVRAAFKGEQLSERIPQQTIEQAIASALLGIDVRPFDRELEQRNLARRAQGLLSSLKGDARSAVKKAGEDEKAAEAPKARFRARGTELMDQYRDRAEALGKATPPPK